MVTLDGLGGMFLQGPPPLIEYTPNTDFLKILGGAQEHIDIPDRQAMVAFTFQGIQPDDDRVTFASGFYNGELGEFYRTCLTHLGRDLTTYREGPALMVEPDSTTPIPAIVLVMGYEESRNRFAITNLTNNAVYGLLVRHTIQKRG